MTDTQLTLLIGHWYSLLPCLSSLLSRSLLRLPDLGFVLQLFLSLFFFIFLQSSQDLLLRFFAEYFYTFYLSLSYLLAVCDGEPMGVGEVNKFVCQGLNLNGGWNGSKMWGWDYFDDLVHNLVKVNLNSPHTDPSRLLPWWWLILIF